MSEDNPFSSVPLPDPTTGQPLEPNPFAEVPLPTSTGMGPQHTPSEADKWWIDTNQDPDSEPDNLFSNIPLPDPVTGYPIEPNPFAEIPMPTEISAADQTSQQEVDRKEWMNRELQLAPTPEGFIPKSGVEVVMPESGITTITPWREAGLPVDKNYYPQLAKAAAGWKLHLNFDATNPDVIAKVQACLEELHEQGLSSASKIGNGGGVEAGAPGKEATIGVGHKDDAQKVAELINQRLGDVLLPVEGTEVETDDTPFTDKVWGRFDVLALDPDFTKSGARGHQILTKDVENIVLPGGRYHGLEGQEARSKFWADAVDRAEPLLAYRYGEFFTGTQQSQ